MLRYIHIEMKCWAWNSLILSFHWLLTHPMLTDAWQIPPGSLLLSVVYPLAQITVLPPSLSPISVVLPPLPLSHQCGFASRSPTMDPWHGQANAASCRTLPEAAPFLSFMPFLLWLSLFEFFFLKNLPSNHLHMKPHPWACYGGILTESHLLSKYLEKKLPNMKKEARVLHGNNTIDKSKQIGKTHLGHVTKHSFPWYIRALESGKSLSLVRLFVTPWTSPWNSPGQNTGVTE